MGEAPERAHVLIAKFGADTPERLADELRFMADQIDREKLSTGCSGSPSGGAIYSYKIRPEQTHDVYFAQIEDWLAERKNPSPETNPVAWWWEDKTGCFHLTLDRDDVHQMARGMSCEARPLYSHPAPPENRAMGSEAAD